MNEPMSTGFSISSARPPAAACMIAAGAYTRPARRMSQSTGSARQAATSRVAS
jgi:hypothetical protein